MKTRVTCALVEVWTQTVFALKQHFCTVLEAPYWVDGLNIECWLAILLDPNITQPFFMRMRQSLKDVVDTDFLAGHYADKTEFARKLDLIDRFFVESEKRRLDRALKCIRQIVHDFPRTGTHYREPGAKYFKLMKQLAREAKQGKRA